MDKKAGSTLKWSRGELGDVWLSLHYRLLMYSIWGSGLGVCGLGYILLAGGSWQSTWPAGSRRWISTLKCWSGWQFDWGCRSKTGGIALNVPGDCTYCLILNKPIEGASDIMNPCYNTNFLSLISCFVAGLGECELKAPGTRS